MAPSASAAERRAFAVSLASASLARATHEKARTTSSLPWPRAASMRETSIWPDVMVPVLSRQRVSTRASVSTQYACCTSTPRWPRRVVAIARTDDVRRTSPWGIMPRTALVEVRMALSTVPPSMSSDRTNSPTPSGTRTMVPSLMMARSVSSISERTAFTYFASALIFAAYPSRPTRVTRATRLPVSTKLPLKSSSPADLAMGTDSPVSRLSST